MNAYSKKNGDDVSYVEFSNTVNFISESKQANKLTKLGFCWTESKEMLF